MNDNGFSCSRMWALTKRYAAENKRNIALTAGTIFGIMLIIFILETKSLSYEAPSRNAAVTLTFLWLGAFIGQIIGSLTFSANSTKAKRISNLMLPAAQSEKFFSQVLIYVIGGNLALILIFLLADSISALMFGMSPGWLSIDLASLFQIESGSAAFVFQFFALVCLFMLWLYLTTQAIYVIGSALWPRRSFLKTFVAILVLQIGGAILIPSDLLIGFFPGLYNLFSEDLTVNQRFALAWGIIVVLYAVLVGLYYVAWTLYKRTEVVKRFMK